MTMWAVGQILISDLWGSDVDVGCGTAMSMWVVVWCCWTAMSMWIGVLWDSDVNVGWGAAMSMLSLIHI